MLSIVLKPLEFAYELVQLASNCFESFFRVVGDVKAFDFADRSLGALELVNASLQIGEGGVCLCHV